MKEFIPYSRQTIEADDVSAVLHSVTQNYLTTGPRVEEFEEALAHYTGAEYAVVCNNATAGLHLSCLALDVTSSSVGVTSPITFLSSANCFEFCGAQTDFVDVDDSTVCLDLDKLEERCRRSRVDVVVAVSFAGVCYPHQDLWRLAQQYGFKVIEDAAHSLGSSYECGEKQLKSASCSHSDLAVLSFHPVKNITTGEGGAVLTNSKELADRVRKLRSHGMRRAAADAEEPWRYDMETLGWNYRLTDVQCALGIQQLRKLDRFVSERLRRYRRYQEKLAHLEEYLRLPQEPNAQAPAYHLYIVRFKEGATRRKQVYTELKTLGICCQVHYLPVYLQPYYKKRYGFESGYCPNAETYYEECLSLPLYPELSDEEQERVIVALENACSRPL